MLAIASGGGHWVQLTRVLPALEGCELTVASVDPQLAQQVPGAKFVVIPDATAWSKWALLRLAARVFFLVLRTRPSVVISTGAAPGYFGLRIGSWFGARTVWIDSIANSEKLSRSGERVGKFADLWLTQWEHLARPDGPRYLGSVL